MRSKELIDLKPHTVGSIYSIFSMTHKLHVPFLTNDLAVMIKFSSRSQSQDVFKRYPEDEEL